MCCFCRQTNRYAFQTLLIGALFGLILNRPAKSTPQFVKDQDGVTHSLGKSPIVGLISTGSTLKQRMLSNNFFNCFANTYWPIL